MPCIGRVAAGTGWGSVGLWPGRSQICQRRAETGSAPVRARTPGRIDLARVSLRIGAVMEAKFLIFLILLTVLAGTALVARRTNVAPAILLLLTGIALAFVPGMPPVE